MSWKSLVNRFGPWRFRFAGHHRPQRPAGNNAPSTPPPDNPGNEADRQNRSFDQWCRRGRGRESNQEL